jgi:hypothetical protein
LSGRLSPATPQEQRWWIGRKLDENSWTGALNRLRFWSSSSEREQTSLGGSQNQETNSDARSSDKNQNKATKKKIT